MCGRIAADVSSEEADPQTREGGGDPRSVVLATDGLLSTNTYLLLVLRGYFVFGSTAKRSRECKCLFVQLFVSKVST